MTPDNAQVTVISVRNIVREFLDKYSRELVGSKFEEELVRQLEQVNS